MPLLGDDDPLGCHTFATHRLPPAEALRRTALREKADGHSKVQLTP